jgi:hypothetical protein
MPNSDRKQGHYNWWNNQVGSLTQIGLGAIELIRFEKGDTILGIGVRLDVDSYGDGLTFNKFDKSTYGPADTIRKIEAYFQNSKDTLLITDQLYNDSTNNKLLYSCSYERREGSMTLDDDGVHLNARVYNDLYEFMNMYNDRSMFSKSGRFEAEFMEEEFFFWIDDHELIKKIGKNGVISVIIHFDNRIIQLKGER